MKNCFIIIILLLFPLFIKAQQKIQVADGKSGVNIISESDTNIIVNSNINELLISSKQNENGSFSVIQAKGYNKNYSNPGKPDLPVRTELIEIPRKAKPEVRIKDYDEKIINLNKLDYNKIIPAQPSYFKSADPDTISFKFDKKYYSQNQFSDYQAAKIEIMGIMRGVRTAAIKICPFDYNPVTNQLRVKYNIEIEISFEDADLKLTEIKKKKYFSPLFSSSYKKLINYSPANTRDNISDYPMKYVIIADSLFKNTLQPFINWKTHEGYKVVDAYVGDTLSNDTLSIKNYLADIYNNATPSDPAPVYVLFVGDYANLTAWDGRDYNHITDLYYCTFNGSNDYLPDMYYGRLSAENVSELQNTLDKIIPYEKYELPSGDFLDKCVMVAGEDNSFAPTHGDGQIYYGINEYFNNSNAYSDIYAYYYNLTSGPYNVMSSQNSSASQDIINKISSGVGFANYTAHCNYNGWGAPSFVRSDVNNLNNVDEYPFMIGNCCLSNEFNRQDAFGEMIVYSKDKGAIGYIGGTNSTLWDEDFYWSAGLNSLAFTGANADMHKYSNTGPGAYDGNWHKHGEPFSDWFITARQMIHSGNLAVAQSGSSYKRYYWEIYQLFGDPSMMPYMTKPENLNINYAIPMEGDTSLYVNAEAYTYVAVSQNDSLWDARWSGNSSYVILNFDSISQGSDSLRIVATKQNKAPHINTFKPVFPQQPEAGFYVSDTVVYEGDSINFYDTSMNASIWQWDFGNGKTSFHPDPVHIYNNPGFYTVKQKVTNPMGSDSVIKTDLIEVKINTDPPVADFSAGDTIVNPGDTITFTDKSANNPDSLYWHFEGGIPSSSNLHYPQIIYNSTGFYDVSLKAYNPYGNDSLLKSYYIHVKNDYCDAGANEYSSGEYIAEVQIDSVINSSGNSSYTDFTGINAVIASGDSVFLSVLNGYSQYNKDKVIAWIDFNSDGDFNDSLEKVFESPIGTGAPQPFYDSIYIPLSSKTGYTRLRIRLFDTQNNPNNTPCGYCEWGEVEDYTVKIIQPDSLPVADFTVSDTSTCSGEVQFIDQSAGAATLKWDFGDGNVSYLENPLHTYSSNGIYTVKLTAFNNMGSDSIIKNSYINVDMPQAPLVTGDQVCDQGQMNLNAMGSGNGDILWYDKQAGDSVIFTGNNYTDYFNYTDTLYAAERYPGDISYGAKYDSSSNGGYYSGNNENGLIFDALRDIRIKSVKVYAGSTGTRTFYLYKDLSVLIDSVSVNISSGESRVDLDLLIPKGDNYKLTASAAPDLYRNEGGWFISDLPYPFVTPGALSVKGNTHNDPGYYYYFYDWEIEKLSYCISPKVPVIAQVNPLPAVDPGKDTTICETDSLVLDGGGAYTTWLWSTGDTSSSITIDTAGVYSLTVADINGCSNSDSVIVETDTMPYANILPLDTVCSNDSTIMLNAYPSGGNWYGNDVSGQYFYPAQAGTGNHVIYYDYSQGACTNTDSANIYVEQEPPVNIVPNGNFCIGDSAKALTATPQGGIWTGNAVFNGVFYPDSAGIGDHKVNYIFSQGFCTVNKQINIKVGEEPALNPVITEATTPASNDGSILLNVSGGLIPYDFYWSTGDTLNEITGLSKGYYAVTVSDIAGCSVSDSIFVGSLTSINEKEVKINVYPNPVKDEFIIDAAGTGEYKLNIKDVTGKNVMERTVIKNPAIINVEELKPGIYYLHLNTDRGVTIRKIVVGD